MPLLFGRQMTPEEIRERDARWEAAAVEDRARHQRLVDAASSNRAALAVIELHQPEINGDRRECGGCDFGGYEAEPVDYPCSTIQLLERLYGFVGETIAGEVVPTQIAASRGTPGPHLHFEQGRLT